MSENKINNSNPEKEKHTDNNSNKVQFDKENIKKDKIIAALSYVSILILIPIFAKPKSKYVNSHIKQGINLLILEIIYSILSTVYNLFNSALYNAAYHPMSWIFSMILTIFFVILIILTIVGFVNALLGTTKKLPLIGNWKIIK